MNNQHLKRTIVSLFFAFTISMSFSQTNKELAFIYFVQLKHKAIPIDTAAIQILTIEEIVSFETFTEEISKRFGRRYKKYDGACLIKLTKKGDDKMKAHLKAQKKL